MPLDADLLALRTPTRSNGLARAEVLPPGAAIWTEGRAEIDFSRWNRESMERRFDPAITAQLVDLQSADAPPEDAAVLGVLGRLVRRGVDRLALAVGGVEGALRYMLAFANAAPQPYFSFLPPLSEATRTATLTLPDDAHEAALRVARGLVATAPVEAVLAIADCFPDDPQLVETAAQGAMASSLTPLPARIFGALRRPDLVMRAIERRPKNSLVALLPVAVDLVVNLGPEAAAPLAALLAARPSDGAPEVLVAARALASLDTEAAGRALVLFLDSKVLAPVAEAWCKRMGDAARAPLEAASRGDLRQEGERQTRYRRRKGAAGRRRCEVARERHGPHRGAARRARRTALARAEQDQGEGAAPRDCDGSRGHPHPARGSAATQHARGRAREARGRPQRQVANLRLVARRLARRRGPGVLERSRRGLVPRRRLRRPRPPMHFAHISSATPC
ncbi:MAG: hypothetical protein HOO96_07480 [Polyangiaceae bacterium]|nr:hypothetical protein [Polyangiaceae bacterium]